MVLIGLLCGALQILGSLDSSAEELIWRNQETSFQRLYSEDEINAILFAKGKIVDQVP